MPFPFPVISTARATVTTSTATEIVAAVAGQRIHGDSGKGTEPVEGVEARHDCSSGRWEEYEPMGA
jgi:hypothetical protein